MDCEPVSKNVPGAKVKIISYADGLKAMEFAEVSGRVNGKYARDHGFGFHIYHDCRPRIRHLQWTKIAFLFYELQAPSPPEWLLFVDADEVFTEHDYDVYEKFLSRLPPEKVLVVAEDIGGKMPINTGFMALRSNREKSLDLLRLIWNVGRDLKVERGCFFFLVPFQ